MNIGRHHILLTCPSIPVTQVKSGDLEISMLGHAFSTERDESTADLLGRLCAATGGLKQAIPPVLDELAGRFLLLISTKHTLRVVPDAVNSFKVLIGVDAKGQTHLAPDPNLFTAIKGFPLRVDPAWAWTFRQNKFRQMTGFPVGATPHQNVKALPANHVLDIDGNGETTIWRSFPRRAKTAMGREDVAELVWRGLAQAFRNAQRQGHELWFPITSGQDSRFIAAAAWRAWKDGKLLQPIHFYFIEKERTTQTAIVDRQHVEHLRKNGVQVDIFKAKSDSEMMALRRPEDGKRYLSFVAHLVFRYALNQGTAFPKHRLFAMANTAETIKFMHDGPDPTSGQGAAMGLGYPNHPLVKNHLQEWFDEAAPTAKRLGYAVHELLWWETVLTHFSGNMLHYGNAFVPMWCPLNFGAFYEWGLGLPLSDRDHHTSRFFREATAAWWPLMAEFPINPDRRTRTIIALKRLRLYWLYRPLAMRGRWWKSGREQRGANPTLKK